MSQAALFLLVSALVLYVASTTAFIVFLLSKSESLGKAAFRVFGAGLALHFLGKVFRFIELEAIPITNSIEAMNLLALVIGVVFIVVAKRYSVPVLGAFATPLAVVSLGASLAFGRGMGAVPEALRSAWFPVHLGTAILADALFLMAGVAAVAFLVQENRLRKKQLGSVFRKLPPLHVLDEISHRLIVVGFLLMTLGMAAGAYLAKHHWGAYWHWDPRQVASLMTWVFFAAILHARLTIGWQGRRVALVTVIAAVIVMSTLVGLPFFTSTLHEGDFSR